VCAGVRSVPGYHRATVLSTWLQQEVLPICTAPHWVSGNRLRRDPPAPGANQTATACQTHTLYRGRGRVVAVTPLAETSYAIGMVYRCVCVLEKTHTSCERRTQTLNWKLPNFFFLIFNKRVSANDLQLVNKQHCCLLQ